MHFFNKDGAFAILDEGSSAVHLFRPFMGGRLYRECASSVFLVIALSMGGKAILQQSVPAAGYLQSRVSRNRVSWRQRQSAVDQETHIRVEQNALGGGQGEHGSDAERAKAKKRRR